MIDFIGKLIFSPFIIVGYFFKFIGYFMYAMLMCIVWSIQIIVNFFKFIVSLFSKKKNNTKYIKLFSIKDFRNNSFYKNKDNYSQSDFDMEADLWGLAEEDRKIAKRERMSPADFVEAEERNNDVLDTDEWEDE